MDPSKLRIALPRIQGRVGAPSLTHLRGNAAIASRRNAASQLKFGTPRAWQSLPWVTNRAAARGAKKGSTVVSTVKDTGVATSQLVSGRRFAAEEWVMRGR
jgi:hypothetical protein